MSDLQELIARNAVMAYNQGFERGEASERDQIIELLQGQKVSLCKCDNCNTVVHLIDLIKGEQK